MVSHDYKRNAGLHPFPKSPVKGELCWNDSLQLRAKQKCSHGISVEVITVEKMTTRLRKLLSRDVMLVDNVVEHIKVMNEHGLRATSPRAKNRKS